MASPSEKIVQRSEVSALRDVLQNPPAGLSIYGINGPGGVGKSFLLALAMEELDLDALGYLVLSVDGANAQNRGDFFATLNGLFPASLPPPADSDKDYFPKFRQVAAIHRSLMNAASAELAHQHAPQSVKNAASLLLKAAQILNRASPKPNQLPSLLVAKLEDKDVSAVLDTTWELVRDLKALEDSGTSWLPGPLRDLTGITLRNRVKSDLYRVTAKQLRTDLSAAIGGYERKDVTTLTQPKIPGRRRLLLILDDYEVLNPLLADFLIGALVPELASAPFDVVMIILSRDELAATHPGWAQHCKRWLRDEFRLAPFDEPTALDLLARAGIAAERREAIFQTTQGFPFLLSLAIEESTSAGADSALFLRRFVDRTTRWMSASEQEWFLRICYLDHVNEDTLARLFPLDEVAKIQDWFEREPSVRDPAAKDFRVRAIIKDKVLRYEEIRSPSRYRELTQRAADAKLD